MITLHDNRDQPKTIRTFKERFELAWQEMELTNSPIIGCNMAFRASVFAKVGLFDQRFGPGAGIVPSGADMDFVYRVCRSGLKVIYSPDVVLAHNHGRTTDDEIEALQRRYLRGRGGFYCKHILEGDTNVFRRALREFYGMSKKIVGAVIKRKSAAAHTEKMRLLIEGGRTYVKLSRKCGAS
jgi:GT2 family glycosyltransferase